MPESARGLSVCGGGGEGRDIVGRSHSRGTEATAEQAVDAGWNVIPMATSYRSIVKTTVCMCSASMIFQDGARLG